MSHPIIQGVFNYPPEFLEFEKKVSLNTAKSTRPLRTAAYMWTRFLYCALGGDMPVKHRTPSNFAKWNDGLGESGVTLEESHTAIKAAMKNPKKAGGGQ